MSAVESYNAGREDFAALLEESFTRNEALEGTVIKGKVVAIEKDMAIIDVGLKTEGRVALKEFTGPGRDQELKVGDEVEVYLDRIENALGEAVISRDKARREESWVKLEKAFEAREKVSGVIFNTVKGGSTVPLQFRVYDGDTELTDPAVIASFAATRTACTDEAADTEDVPFTTTGNNTLRYTDGHFQQNWKTPKTPGCYQITITTTDGATLTADFHLR
mgnify:CR=1 FL=1